MTVGRCFLTPHDFKHARWSLGRWSRPLTFIALIWNTYLAAVLFSPIQFPVTGDSFNCKFHLVVHPSSLTLQTPVSFSAPSPSSAF